jgi:molybdenum cofactor cytidylyltransferase
VRVAAIVLAAGASSRFGRPKQALVFRGETLVARTIRIASMAADDVILVTAPSITVPPNHVARIVMNTRAEEGISSSIRAGVASAPDDARLLLLLADQPLITPDHLRNLIAQDAPVVATGYEGVAGAPAVFAPFLRGELLQLRGDRGARAVIERQRDAVIVPFEDAAVDIDDEDDFAALLAQKR